jgi:UDPglucose 6-dehydrogenase
MSALPRVGYVGLTHLGLCSAIAAASKGFETIGLTPDPALAASLEAGRLPVLEPGLEELLCAHRARISFTIEPSRLAPCDLIYVAPDVPTDDRGTSDLSPLLELLELTFAHAAPTATIVILSQVPPGFTRDRLRPGRGLYYQVETLIFGRAVERATRPERFIVGCDEPARALPAAFARFLASFGCPVLPMRFESAELAKIAINCCLVASVATANTLAEICEKIGADWSEIVPALRLDARIGPHAYIAPGLGIAGGNLERDLETVVQLGDAFGTDVSVVRAWQRNSRYRREWLLRAVHEHVLATNNDPRLALLGLAYKENTRSTKNSPALALLQALKPYAVTAFDPAVAPRGEWHPRMSRAADALAACEGGDALMIATPWPQFKELRPSKIAARLRGRIVIDPFACLDRAECAASGLTHVTLGLGAYRARRESTSC